MSRGGARSAALAAPLAAALGATLACGCAKPPSQWTEPRTGMPFIEVPAGSFDMGTPQEEIAREPGEVRHRVTLTRPFFLGEFEVTQAEWRTVMGANPSRNVACGPRCPVESVSFEDVQTFLVAFRALSGERLRLPTEAEWEYACRAGTTTPFSTGPNLETDQANYDGRYPYVGQAAGLYRGRVTVVGSFAPNPWGFRDMHGNVWEWCEDDLCTQNPGPATDPLASCGSGRRVIRGGSWLFDAASARCGTRYSHRPEDSGPSLGLRVVREIEW